MIRTGLPSLLILGTLTIAARADIPLPPHLHYIDPVVRFEGLAKLPEYEFRLRFQTFSGGPSGSYTYKTVPDGKAFNLNAERRLIDMQLLGLKREEFERRAKDHKSLNWLTDEVPGVLAAKVSAPSTVANRMAAVPVSNYRVALNDGKLTVEAIADTNKAGFAPPWAPWVSGIALSLGIAGLGLWASRHVRLSRSAATNAAV